MFHVYWPVLACITLILVLGVILAILRYGARWGLRHTPLPDEHEWKERMYEQRISYA